MPRIFNVICSGINGGMSYNSTFSDVCQTSNAIDVSHQTRADPPRFKGVVRKKLANFFISGIDPDCTESDLLEHIKQNDVKCTRSTLFNNRWDDSLCAQIVIWEEHSDFVSDPEFWPPGMSCRKWVTRPANGRGDAVEQDT